MLRKSKRGIDMHVIRTEGLCKSYGEHSVLQNVNFQIASGKLVGFLGPNGAGKTTTIRILLGLLSPSSGEAELFGKPANRSGKLARKQIGYLPGDVHFYPNLTGRRTLEFMAGVRKIDCAREIKRLSDVLQLDLNKTVRKYSTGMRQKLGLIQALMHRPQLLILDEPTSALDPLIRKTVFEELHHVVQDGRTVLFSSHSLHEVEELCDEVIILRNGRVVEQQRIEVLQQRALRKVEIDFGNQKPSGLPEPFQLIRRKGSTFFGTWTGEISELLKWLDGFLLDDLIIERPDLNDLFITYYSEGDSDAGSIQVHGETNHV